MIGRGARTVAEAVVLAAAAIGLLACESSVPSRPGATPVTTTGSPTQSAESPVGSPPATPRVGDPPVASLRVEGGDPVVGQLGTYSWAGGGSSSPWLPGAPIDVGAEEPLIVTMDQPFIVTAWTARLAPAADQDGAQAVVAAEGVGQPVMSVPKRGAWTLAVTVTFGERGSATYAWRLDVS